MLASTVMRLDLYYGPNFYLYGEFSIHFTSSFLKSWLVHVKQLMLKLELIFFLYNKYVTHLIPKGDGVSSHLIAKGASVDILSD